MKHTNWIDETTGSGIRYLRPKQTPQEQLNIFDAVLAITIVWLLVGIVYAMS